MSHRYDGLLLVKGGEVRINDQHCVCWCDVWCDMFCDVFC
jgi:hypothetical protein